MQIHTRPRLLTSLVVIAAAGTVSGVAAAGKVGPFASLGVTARQVAAPLAAAPLRAAPFYPVPTQPPTIHQIVEIQDPPVIVPPSRPPVQAATAPAAPTAPQSAPSPAAPAPTPAPCYEDCQGGGGDN